MQKEKPGERFRYKPMIKAPDRHLYSTRPRRLQYVVGNKFILRGDKINTERVSDEQGPEMKGKITEVVYDEEELPTIVEMNVPMQDIRWKGLWDKNSNNLYAPDQLLPEEEYKSKHKSRYDAQMQRFEDLYEQAKKVMKLNS